MNERMMQLSLKFHKILRGQMQRFLYKGAGEKNVRNILGN